MRMLNTGKVSVIIPSYKRPKELNRAIESVLNQSYTYVEVVVVDDNNDGDEYRIYTESLMTKYAEDKRVKYLKHHKNMNGSAARNTGIANSDGEFIAFLDDDDFFLKDRLEYDLNILQSSENDIAGICSGYLKKYKNHIYKVGAVTRVDNSCYSLLSGQVDYAAGSTLLVRRSAVDAVGGFDPSFYKHQDWEFLIKLFRHYRILATDHIGVVICTDGYRNNTNTEKLISIKQFLLTKFTGELKSLPKEQYDDIVRNQTLEVFHSFLQNGNLRKGLSYLRTKGYNLKEGGTISALYYYIGHYIPQVKYMTMVLFGIKNKKYTSYINALRA